MADLKLLLKDDSGLELSEYVVAAALVVIPLTLAIDNLGDVLSAAINALVTYVRS